MTTCGIHGDDTSSGRCATCDATRRPLAVIVSSAEIAEQDTLSADYWVHRQDSESYPAFRVRRQIEDLERRAQVHDQAAASLRERADQLRETSQ
jgi:hypothetical protein